MIDEKGVRIERTRGTPQGGVVSPILANTFLHYAFDLWMTRTHPDLPWCRYADDGLVHCRSEHEAQVLKDELQARLAECGLELHPTKTKIVYCKDGKRQSTYPTVMFDFLGYCFRPRLVRRRRDNTMFCGFNPAVSVSALKAMRSAIRDLNLRRQTQLTLQDLARQLNPLLRGWIAYYGRSRHRRWPLCCATSIRRCWLGRCASSSASRLTRSGRASSYSSLLLVVRASSCTGNEVWSARLPDGSGVSREAHAPFYESLGVRFPRATLPFISGQSRRGAFQLQRKTRGDRMRAKLKEIKVELRRRMHHPIPEQGRWLKAVVTGFFAYHAVPTNSRALGAFRYHVTDLWRRTLRRRSQKTTMTWDRMTRLAATWLPPPRILHPWPNARFSVTHPR